jgi:hypothetical protein
MHLRDLCSEEATPKQARAFPFVWLSAVCEFVDRWIVAATCAPRPRRRSPHPWQRDAAVLETMLWCTYRVDFWTGVQGLT